MNAPHPAPVKVDAITLEIIRSLLIAILDEGEINLERTAFSPIIYEVKDYCVGLLDIKGRTIAQSRGGVPTFMADLGEPVKDGVEIYGEQGFAPDDVVLCNYAGICGQHLNNMVVYMPIFAGDGLVAFSAIRAHWTDVGGIVPGSHATNTTEIYQEGFQLRTVKVHKGGKPDEEILRIIRHNTRFPDLTMGDMAAQIAACKLINRRFSALLAKYSWRVIEACVQTIWDQSEVYVREQIRMLKPGRYPAYSFLDDDGVDPNRTLDVKLAVIIREDEIEIDFSEMPPQTPGPMNTGRSGGLAAARVAFKSVIFPNLAPNEGAFRPLKVNLPEGTMISARESAAMSLWNVTLKTVIDTIYLAMSPVVPDRVPAGHHAAQGAFIIYGVDERTGKKFASIDSSSGGWGAGPGLDRRTPLKTATHGDTKNVPVEVQETFFPVLVDRFEWRPDSAGPGESRGGLGLKKVYRVEHPIKLTAVFDRSKCKPWGLFGGGEPQVGGLVVHTPDGKTTRYQKITGLSLEPGTRFEILSAGGGGRGPVTKRPVEKVLDDVREGYVSVEAARKDYGVVIDPLTRTVDRPATEAAREAMSASRAL